MRRSTLMQAATAAIAALTIAAAALCLTAPERCGMAASEPAPPRVVGGLYGIPEDVDVAALERVRADPDLSQRLKDLLSAAMANTVAETVDGASTHESVRRQAQALGETERIANPEVRAMALAGIALACLGRHDIDCAFAIANDRLPAASAAEVAPVLYTDYVTEAFVIAGLDPDDDELPVEARRLLDEQITRFRAGNGEGRFEFTGYASGGTGRDPREVSGKFANAVHSYLAAQGIPDDAIAGYYNGEKLVATNRTRAGRARNNRVEIEVRVGTSVAAGPPDGAPSTDANAKWRALIYKAIADGYSPTEVAYAFSPAVTLTLGAIADAASAGYTSTATAIADALGANEQMHWFSYMLTLFAGAEGIGSEGQAQTVANLPLLDMGAVLAAAFAYASNDGDGDLGRELAAAQALALELNPSPAQQLMLSITTAATAGLDPAQVPAIIEGIRAPQLRDWTLTGAAISAIRSNDVDTAVVALQALSESPTRNLYRSVAAVVGLALEWNGAEGPPTLPDWQSHSPTMQSLQRIEATQTLDLVHAGLALASTMPDLDLPGGPASRNDIRDIGLRATVDALMRMIEVGRHDSSQMLDILMVAKGGDRIRLLQLASSVFMFDADLEEFQLTPDWSLLMSEISRLGEQHAPPPATEVLLSVLQGLLGETGLSHLLSALRVDELSDMLLAALVPTVLIARLDRLDGDQPKQVREMRRDLDLLLDFVLKIEDVQIRDFSLVPVVALEGLARWQFEGVTDVDGALAIAERAIERIQDPVFRNAVRQMLALGLLSEDYDAGWADGAAHRELALRLAEQISRPATRDATFAMLAPGYVLRAIDDGVGAEAVDKMMGEIDQRISDPMIKAVALAEMAIGFEDDPMTRKRLLDRAVEVADEAPSSLRDEVLSALVLLFGEAADEQGGIRLALRISQPARRAVVLVLMGGGQAREIATNLLQELGPRERARVLYLMELDRIPLAETSHEGRVREDLGNQRHLFLLPSFDYL